MPFTGGCLCRAIRDEMADTDQNSVGITLGTFDNPSKIHPTVHGWTSEPRPWLDIQDRLPRYSQSPPYEL
jgi:hypothetical protein